MRPVIAIMALFFLLIPACERAEPPEPEVPWTEVPVNWEASPVTDSGYIPLSVIESNRFIPPDEIRWPPAHGEMGKTIIWLEPDGNDGLSRLATTEFINPENNNTVTDYRWDLDSGTLDTEELDLQLSGTYWPPLHQAYFSAAESMPIYHTYFINAGGSSETRKFSVDDGESVGWPIFTAIQCITPSLFSDFANNRYDFGEKELSATEYLLNEKTDCGITSMLVRDLDDYPLEMPDGTIKFVPRWIILNLGMATQDLIVPKDHLIESTFGAKPTLFTGAYIFLDGDSPFDESKYVFIDIGGATVGINMSGFPNTEDDDPHWVVNGIIPMFNDGDNNYFFAQDINFENDTKVKIAAFRLSGTPSEGNAIDLIWVKELPDIFSYTRLFYFRNCSGNQPFHIYIACLERTTGGFTLFDPLTSEIRYQSRIAIATPGPDDPLPSFCDRLYKYRDNDIDPPQVFFIHDPNANEIIELEVSIADSGGPSITPIED